MYELKYLEAMREQVKNWMNITSKCKYRNIHVNDENGLVYLEVHDYLQSQDYELHCFNPLYDIDNIVETLVKNRIEILIRGQQ